MLSALLRSGEIKDYTPLGQDGMAVYTVASQLRDAIKFKRGRSFAEYLAIPQRNEQGDKIDWYVPFDSTRADGQYMIIPWTSATEEERETARAELKIFERTALELGKELIQSPTSKGDQLLFARLLCGGNPDDITDPENLKALRFPNPEHVYLVNDRPVITFWGFLEKHAAAHGNPFLSLQAAEPKPVAPSIPIAPAVAAPIEPVIEKKHPCRVFWWVLPLLLGLLLLLAWWFKDLWWPKEDTVVKNEPVTVSEPKEQKAKKPKKPKEKEVRKLNEALYRYLNGRWVDHNGVSVTDSSILNNLNTAPVVGDGNVSGDVNSLLPTTDDIKVDALNNDKAGDIKADENKMAGNAPQPPVDPLAENKADIKADQNNGNTNANLNTADNKNNPTASGDAKNIPANNNATSPMSGNAKPLQIPTASTQNGNVDFLNGRWNAGAGIQDKTTGKPLRLSYAFSDGVGQVQVQRGDGVQCTGDVSAKMQGNGLNIANKGVAKCSDGSSYQLPEVICKPGATSVADCQGGYGSGQGFPMTMKSN